MLSLHKTGALGESMFTSKLKDLVDQNLAATIRDACTKLKAEAIKSKIVLNEETLQLWRTMIVDAVENDVSSLEILPSKRKVTIAYRNAEIPEVPVGSLVDHIDYSIVAIFKSAAIAQNKLQPLEAETMMGFASTADDAKLLIDPEWFSKAGCARLKNKIMNSEVSYIF